MKYFLSLICLFLSFSAFAQVTEKDEEIIYEVISSLKENGVLKKLNNDTIFVSIKGIGRNISNYYFVKDKAIFTKSKIVCDENYESNNCLSIYFGLKERGIIDYVFIRGSRWDGRLMIENSQDKYIIKDNRLLSKTDH